MTDYRCGRANTRLSTRREGGAATASGHWRQPPPDPASRRREEGAVARQTYDATDISGKRPRRCGRTMLRRPNGHSGRRAGRRLPTWRQPPPKPALRRRGVRRGAADPTYDGVDISGKRQRAAGGRTARPAPRHGRGRRTDHRPGGAGLRRAPCADLTPAHPRRRRARAHGALSAPGGSSARRPRTPADTGVAHPRTPSDPPPAASAAQAPDPPRPCAEKPW
jgi:hypothetical protein